MKAGSGGLAGPGSTSRRRCAGHDQTCPLARIIDVRDGDQAEDRVAAWPLGGDTTRPTALKVPARPVRHWTFTYAATIASVDNKHHATTLAAAIFNSALRVFDIRNRAPEGDRLLPKPAGETTLSPGSNHNNGSAKIISLPGRCEPQENALVPACRVVIEVAETVDDVVSA